MRSIRNAPKHAIKLSLSSKLLNMVRDTGLNTGLNISQTVDTRLTEEVLRPPCARPAPGRSRTTPKPLPIATRRSNAKACSQTATERSCGPSRPTRMRPEGTARFAGARVEAETAFAPRRCAA